MSNALLNKLSFNGFHVTFYNHETRQIEQQSFPLPMNVEARGFKDDFPDAKNFAEDLFDVYGDRVGVIVDNAGLVLYDRRADMHRLYDEMVGW